MYYDCRYISASEASWRLFGYEIHFREPNVVRLGFHLPDKQSVIFQEGAVIEDVLDRPSSRCTMFTAWMEANKRYSKAKELTYAEFPKWFVWDAKQREWRPRKKGTAYGRLYYVYPGSGELYFLRILLNVVRGCESYEDIRTFNGFVYPSFRDACYARGLLDDDREYIDAIVEASFWGSEDMLRSLFVTLLMSDSISRPEFVWNMSWSYLSADIQFKYRCSLIRQDLVLTEDQVKNLCLREIEHVMQRRGRSLREYPSMPYPEHVDVVCFGNQLISDELSYDRDLLTVEHNKYLGMLNHEQRHVYTTIMRAVDSQSGGLYFLYGHGGTGKTFVWKTLSAAIRSRGGIVLNVASSGIASLLLPGGRTAHSRFAIPLNLNEISTCNIKQPSELAELIEKTDLTIWDEAPMMNRFCFEALDRSLRDIMRNKRPEVYYEPFGGKIIVFGGDFRHILPVIPKGTRQDIVHATISSSPIWRHCKVLRLTKNMRLQCSSNDIDIEDLRSFSNWLTSIGDGTLGGDNDGEIEIQIPDDLLITKSNDFIRSIVDATYPDFSYHIGELAYLQGRAILGFINKQGR
ncbi:hypothetical protein OROMI_008553 [Orobanche minor]